MSKINLIYESSNITNDALECYKTWLTDLLYLLQEAKMDKKFIDEMVKAHNEYRSVHQVWQIYY